MLFLNTSNPDVKIAKLTTKIEFLKPDGTFSDEVYEDGKTEALSGPFTLSSSRHIFKFGEKTLQAGLNMGCFVQVVLITCRFLR